MDFPYPRLQYGIRFCLMMCLLAGILFLLSIPDIDMMWLALFGIVFFAAVALTTLSPMTTVHTVGREGIILKQGLLFALSIPFAEIESVGRLETRLWAFGLIPTGARGRIVLASGIRNLVEIRLRQRKRFGMLLWRSSKEIVIDLNDPDGFVKAAEGGLLQQLSP